MRRILLVEDESSAVSFILKGFTEEGFEVSVVLDGGTSGSAILNRKGEVVASSYAGFTIPNDKSGLSLNPFFLY